MPTAAPRPGRRRGRLRCFIAPLAVVLVTLGAFAAVRYWPAGPQIERVKLGGGIPKPTFVRSIGSSGPPLREPIGLAARGGRLYVADALLGEVLVYDDEGNYLMSFGKGTLQTPLYVAESPLDGHVYVTDRRAAGVHVFDRTGASLGTFFPKRAEDGPDPGTEWQPLDISFSDSGIMYVTDASVPQRALKISATGVLLAEVGRSEPLGRDLGLLGYANGIVPSGQDVLVADSNNKRLLYLDSHFRPAGTSSFSGLPRGVCVVHTSVGRVYAVVDAAASRVEFVDSRGAGLQSFSGVESTAGPLYKPNDVAYEDGRLYVSDTGNRRIVEWRVASGGAPTTLLPALGGDARRTLYVGLSVVAAIALLTSLVPCFRRRHTL